MSVELESADNALRDIARYADRDLKPLARAVDQNGLYPKAFLSGLGKLHGYGGIGDSEQPSVDLQRQLKVIEAVGRRCGATAFSVWCQSACAWYLHNSTNAAPREKYLRDVLDGSILAGTGMSNTLKHLSKIEDIRLRARVQDSGYVIDGALPWISNLGPKHLLITAAAVDKGSYVMFAVRTDAAGIQIKSSPRFSGMMGVGTYSVRFRSVTIPADDVLADPGQFKAFLARIKPGMILSQVGIGLGIMKGCLDILKAIPAGSKTNPFLEDSPSEIRDDLAIMEAGAQLLARNVQSGVDTSLLPVLRLRARTSERTLRIAESTVLRCGARGYLASHPVQRRLREAIFVAIFTPALKHLRKDIHELHELEMSAGCLG